MRCEFPFPGRTAPTNTVPSITVLRHRSITKSQKFRAVTSITWFSGLPSQATAPRRVRARAQRHEWRGELWPGSSRWQVANTQVNKSVRNPHWHSLREPCGGRAWSRGRRFIPLRCCRTRAPCQRHGRTAPWPLRAALPSAILSVHSQSALFVYVQPGLM